MLSRRALLRVAGLGLLVCACVLWPAVAQAATVTVTTTSDTPAGGQCSLRLAVMYADGTAEPNCAPGTATPPTTIKVPAGTYTLSGSGLSLTAGMTIAGAGAGKTTISGGNAVQPISVGTAAIVTISGVTITDGVSGVPSTGCSGSGVFRTCPAENGNNGGGIANAGSLTLTDDVISGNAASGGTLPIALLLVCLNGNCSPRPGESGGYGGDGGGIYNAGQLSIERSTISHNVAGAGASGTNGVSGSGTQTSAGQNGGNGGDGGIGGAIFNDSHATLTIDQSAITANRAGAGGNAGAGSTATNAAGTGGNSGFSGSGGGGGGIATVGAVTVTNSTINGNTTGAGGNGAPAGAGTGGQQNGQAFPAGIGGYGGGVWMAAPSVPVKFTNVTLTANATAAGGTGGAGGIGGGLYVFEGVAQLSFVTIAANAATGSGGGVVALPSSIAGAAVIESNSIIASNRGTPVLNCATTVTDDGHNLVFGDSSCPGTSADPRLGPLQDNGGPTQTMALGPGSGALGLVPANDCPVDTDQRGVTRPQGTRCDAGAYELAPPSLTAPAASAGQTGASITASIIPNLQPTRVVVRYGRTTGYGSATTAHPVGSGNDPVAFSTTLTGLSRLQTYHAQIVATNADGTTTSSDLTFTTGLSAAIVSASTKGATLLLRIACRGGAAARCAGPIAVTSRVTRRAGKPVAVSARSVKRRPVKIVAIVAQARYAVAAGTSRTVRVTLNRTGRGLLKRFHRLPATVTVSGASPPHRRVVFGAARRRRHR